MNIMQRGFRSIIRKPIKSILLLLVVVVISSFFMAGLSGQSANIKTQDATRQAVGATFRLEENEANRHKRIDEATKIIGEDKEGTYGGFTQKQLPNGAWMGKADNSFETIKPEDAQKIAGVDGIEAYNLITVSTPVNPVNFKRIEDPDVDQSSDLGGVNVRGNRIMEMDMDVASGKIKLVEGRMIKENETDVCVVSDELAKLNSLKPGDELQFNNAKDKENSQEYSAKIVGIYKTTQKIKPVMSGDTYRSENTIFTDLHFPEKASGEEGNPLFQYAIFKVKDVDAYDRVKADIQKVDIGWERYDLIDNNGNIKSMAENFNDMEKISRMLLLLVSSASFIILVLIFLFWMKNRTQEIGILMALGESKKRIWMQFLVEALLVGCIGFVLSMGASPFLSKATASYLARQTQEQAEEQAEADADSISTDRVAPELTMKGTEIVITGKMVAADAAVIVTLLFVSVSVAGITIMRKKPKEILSEMS
ncbi:efflux ABC transporter, permease protein [[Clostridium] scindens ATCC 35704]|uniref:Macrolide export ATP-binding/permease protein MacB n=1 Tax=Clostridium scindens (strain ATCC 35704 / DSM 5676 / VPI 13733 / 19) TaxID=411468 RepID=B0NIR9_CLOS5|nr:ABC transporter permease [[Clostridium] scindens]EDS05509.1 efflux ABC transporter, permease protein [[Clostridium] scindens ATCC 35704]QBF75258.1 Macrolide export ATP-binding/permease protein MacB [[Clostridium] scindens ATCC 35704]QRO38401.1 ABC transporter permease [[Clostridium] scindens]BDF16243.1 putative ABC transporter permease YclI [[Clostridium] scindens]BDF19941.1 putative ABC transporter permease YclI [[Clostridium] scindens]